MRVSALIDQLKQVNTYQDLCGFLAVICADKNWKNCGLLSRNPANGILEAYPGQLSDEIKDWLRKTNIRNQIENDHTLLLLYYRTPGAEQDTGFVLSAGTPAYAAVWWVVEYRLGAVSEEDVLMCMALSRYVADVYRQLTGFQRTTLTNRERECMRWIADGKTSWEIARLLGLTERTVNFHVQNCIHKTNSVNRSQAITKCITQYLIHLSPSGSWETTS